MKEIALRLILLFWELPLKVRKCLLPLFKGLISIIGYKGLFSELAGIDNECKLFGKEPTTALRNDIISAWILFGASPKEYFLYGFPALDEKERDTFLTDHYRTQVLKKKIGIQFFKNELINKYGFYQKNKKFFGRKCLLVSPNTSFDEFYNFIYKAGGKIFIKDNNGSFGSNGHAISYETDEQLYDEYKKIIETNGKWIAEEFVVQDEKLACWNETSVNTIRIPSYLTLGDVQIFRPFIRTGRAGACVDNAGAGGIFATIDEATGEIITDGADELGHFYIEHPDSKIVYKGWKVPMWNELLSVAKEAHLQMPEHKYIAYDFALTPSGWVMIEGNWGQYMCQQTSTRKGQKNGFLRLMNS